MELPNMLQALKSTQYISAQQHTFTHYDVFIDDEVGEPSEYREFISTLFNSGEGDTITIYINSPGGHLDSALSIIEGLKNTQAHVTGVIMGACHSAASLISMYCHEVAVMDNAYSLVHTASFGSSGNTNNVRSHTEFTVRMVEKLLNETYEGFLSKEELEDVKHGVELWFDADDIRKRMQSRVKYLTAKQKKAVKTPKE
jgi:ATP-dependent Clp protease protease subunit